MNIIQFANSAHKFTHLFSICIVCRFKFKLQLFSGGTRNDQLNEIDRHVFQKFREHRGQRIRVHDRNLIRWGSEKGREIQLNFRASHHWLLSFKRRHNIVSRKITRQISRKNQAKEPVITASATEFIDKIKPIFSKNPARISNSDQASFRIELYPGRTLEERGTRQVEATVVSKHSLTHSYTVMPIISGDGRLIKPTLIVHQTPKGAFGERVLKSMFSHESILVRTTTSGKVTKKILQEWATEIFFKGQNTNNSLLLLDSFTLHKDRANLDKNKPRSFKYDIEYIPAGTTDQCQPLDKEPNHTLKQMVRNMTEFYMINDDRIINRTRLSSRDAIDMIQVLSLNQFDSPRFREWIAHSWKSCGYTSNPNLHASISPNKFCFDDEVYRRRCCQCEHSSFIRCGWCNCFFCELHFFFCDQIHFCSVYEE